MRSLTSVDNSFEALGTLPTDGSSSCFGSGPRPYRITRRQRARGRLHKRAAHQRRQAEKLDAELSALIDAIPEQTEQGQAGPRTPQWLKPERHETPVDFSPQSSDECYQSPSQMSVLEPFGEALPMLHKQPSEQLAMIKYQPSRWQVAFPQDNTGVTQESLFHVQPTLDILELPKLAARQCD